MKKVKENPIEKVLNVNTIVANSGSIDAAIEKAKPYLEKAIDIIPYELMDIQKILFCHCVKVSLNIGSREVKGGWLFGFGNHLKLKEHDTATLIGIEEKLIRDRYLEFNVYNSNSNNIYEPLLVPQNILKDLANGSPIDTRDNWIFKSTRHLFKNCLELLKLNRRGRMSSSDLDYNIQKFIMNNKENTFVKAFLTIYEKHSESIFIPSAIDFLFTVLAFEKAMDQESFKIEDLIERISEGDESFELVSSLFESNFDKNKHPLLVEKILQRERSTLVSSRSKSYEVTQHGIQTFLGAEASSLINDVKDEELTYPDQIRPKKLIFEGELLEELKSIERFLTPSKYSEVKSKISKQFGGEGISILLHGQPGTGKTEWLLQLCKLTGRPLMKVDLADTKSMWHGQSEQLTKEIFTKYRRHLRRNKVEPILFINEADGLFSKRLDVRHSIDQTLNTVQNILLEELEKFEGILIATTNLIHNLDSAFDRRFLMKVKFSSGGLTVRESLWRQLLNFEDFKLKKFNYQALAKNFTLTPAQIQNVALKLTTLNLIGDSVTEEKIYSFCLKELGDTGKKIGF